MRLRHRRLTLDAGSPEKAHSLEGFRVGYAVLPERLADDLNAHNDAYPLARPSQAAAIATDAMLRRATARGIETVKGVVEALPFPDGGFEYALIVTTICFVDSPVKMIAEAHRVLRPGGKLVIGFIDRQSGLGKPISMTSPRACSIGRPSSIQRQRSARCSSEGASSPARGDRPCVARSPRSASSNRFAQAPAGGVRDGDGRAGRSHRHARQPS